jgi:hypothetical protein
VEGETYHESTAGSARLPAQRSSILGAAQASRVGKDALLMLAEKVTEKVWTSRKVRGLDASAPRVITRDPRPFRAKPGRFCHGASITCCEHHVAAQQREQKGLETIVDTAQPGVHIFTASLWTGKQTLPLCWH